MKWLAFPIGIALACLWSFIEKRWPAYQRLLARLPSWFSSAFWLVVAVACSVLYWTERRFGWFGFAMFGAGLQLSAIFFGSLYEAVKAQRDESLRLCAAALEQSVEQSKTLAGALVLLQRVTKTDPSQQGQAK